VALMNPGRTSKPSIRYSSISSSRCFSLSILLEDILTIYTHLTAIVARSTAAQDHLGKRMGRTIEHALFAAGDSAPRARLLALAPVARGAHAADGLSAGQISEQRRSLDSVEVALGAEETSICYVLFPKPTISSLRMFCCWALAQTITKMVWI